MPARRLHVLVAGAGAAVPIRMIPYGNELPNRINLFRLFRLVSVAVLICFDSFGSDFFRSILVSTPKNRRIHSVRRFERITATEQPACDGGAERSPCAPAAPRRAAHQRLNMENIARGLKNDGCRFLSKRSNTYVVHSPHSALPMRYLFPKTALDALQ